MDRIEKIKTTIWTIVIIVDIILVLYCWILWQRYLHPETKIFIPATVPIESIAKSL